METGLNLKDVRDVCLVDAGIASLAALEDLPLFVNLQSKRVCVGERFFSSGRRWLLCCRFEFAQQSH